MTTNNHISLWDTDNEDFAVKLVVKLNKKWNFGFETIVDGQQFIVVSKNPKCATECNGMMLDAIINYCHAFNDGYEAADLNWKIESPQKVIN